MYTHLDTGAGWRRSSAPSPRRAGITLDRVAFACLCAFVFSIPWAEQLPLLAGFVIGRWLGLLTVGVALIRLAATRRVRRLSHFHLWMSAFVAWSSLSIIWSKAPDRTMVRIGTYLQLLIMAILIWELAPTGRRWTALLYSYCFGTLISASSTIRNAILGLSTAQTSMSSERWRSEGFGEGRYAATGFDSNELGLLLALSIPMTLYLLSRKRRGVAAYLCWLQLIVCTVAIVLTGSRGAFVALLVASTMFAAVYSGFNRRQRVVSVLIIVGLIACCACVIPVATWERLLTIRSELTQGTLSHRLDIWSAGLSVFREHPLLGVGSGAFGPSASAMLNTDYVAHNSFLSVLVELGLTGAWIFAVLLTSMAVSIARMDRIEKRFWIVLLLTWGTGVFALTWEYSKPTWLLFALFAVHAGIVRNRAAALRFSGPRAPRPGAGRSARCA